MATGVRITPLQAPDSTGDRPLVGTPTALHGSRVRAGAVTPHRPIAIRSLNPTGVRQTSFRDDWYNRLHILPRLVDFGAVGQQTTRDTVLWNAYFSATTLSTVTIVNNTGLALSGPSVPRTLKPLGTVTYGITALEDGAATIDSRVNFITDHGTQTVDVFGTRAHLWPFKPNWGESVSISVEFKTDKIVTRSGREQRRALRKLPRKSVEVSVTAHQVDLRRFRQSMAKWQNRPVLMADPVRHSRVAAVISSTVLLIADRPEWLVDGVVLQFGESVSTVQIAEPVWGGYDIGDCTRVTLRAPLETSAGVIVRPTLDGLLESAVAATLPTNAVARVAVTFNVTPGSDTLGYAEPGYDILDGREVFIRRPNWSTAPSVSSQWPVEQVDFGYGRIATFRPIEFGTVTTKQTFVEQGRDDTFDLESFFGRARGQRGEFYLPSGINDLPPVAVSPAGSAFIRVAGTEVFDAYDGDTVHRAVAIYTGGLRIYRKILGMYVDQGDTVLQTDRAFLTDIPVGAMVSWMPVTRMATDTLQMEWLTDTVAQTQMAMQSLEALPVEDPIADFDGAGQWLLEVWGAFGVLDDLDYLVNIAYPAIWWIPEAWVSWDSTFEGLRGLDRIVNHRYPETTAG